MACLYTTHPFAKLLFSTCRVFIMNTSCGMNREVTNKLDNVFKYPQFIQSVFNYSFIVVTHFEELYRVQSTHGLWISWGDIGSIKNMVHFVDFNQILKRARRAELWFKATLKNILHGTYLQIYQVPIWRKAARLFWCLSRFLFEHSSHKIIFHPHLCFLICYLYGCFAHSLPWLCSTIPQLI